MTWVGLHQPTWAWHSTSYMLPTQRSSATLHAVTSAVYKYFGYSTSVDTGVRAPAARAQSPARGVGPTDWCISDLLWTTDVEENGQA